MRLRLGEKTDLNEQRKTKWVDTESLDHFLDPEDETKTVEGYPAPKRVYIKAKLKPKKIHRPNLMVSSNPVKRYDLAEEILVNLPSNFEIITMSNIIYLDVPLYISACDALLITSDSEGSPNIVRECLALNRPIFSYDVGDVKKYLELTKNSKIIPKDTQKAASIIQYQLNMQIIENTRISMRYLLSNELILSELISIYE